MKIKTWQSRVKMIEIIVYTQGKLTSSSPKKKEQK